MCSHIVKHFKELRLFSVTVNVTVNSTLIPVDSLNKIDHEAALLKS